MIDNEPPTEVNVTEGKIGQCENQRADTVFRLLGSLAVDTQRPTSPMIFCVGSSLITGLKRSEKLHVLYRASWAFDAVKNVHPAALELRFMTMEEIESALDAIEVDQSSSRTSGEELWRLDCHERERKFYSKWKPMPEVGTKWSRGLSRPVEIPGSIEASFPYILVRGEDVVEEFRRIVSDSFLLDLLGAQLI